MTGEFGPTVRFFLPIDRAIDRASTIHVGGFNATEHRDR
jgi:hypothetical protein